MRKVTFTMNISLDGYCDHTIGEPDEEVMSYFAEQVRGVDVFFFGRIMYQLMFPYWADVAREQSGTAAENRFAVALTAAKKVVVSTTLSEKTADIVLVRSNPAEALLKLKHQPGGLISVDSVSMLPELVAADLIDEFNLVVHPVMVGKGRRLLDAATLQDKLKLKLNEVVKFKSGCVALHYTR
ncbi:deaminase [Pedobacter yulinensis]|uniref:Deaminase n=1 Tax=Pedobacter yulinensis TaxID=2126353 RepID=A0A2T3HHE7_9SPHI|nr:dihydrofolate reductase family protein [Pedobacter yulinensis]PST81852.1 deaminase [Pedobacter yulinensis]